MSSCSCTACKGCWLPRLALLASHLPYAGCPVLCPLQTQSLEGCTDCLPQVADKGADMSINQ